VLARPLPAEALDRVQGDLEAARPRRRLDPATAKGEQDAAALPAHLADRGALGQEMRAHRGRDRLQEVLG